ncbi:LytTR family DNA-binding domain-containing protein [Mycoplasmatota bacterium zrk1]
MKIKIICYKEKLIEIKENIQSGHIEFVNEGEDFVLTESTNNKNYLLGIINDDYLIIKPYDIVFVESFGNDIFCHTSNGKYLIRERLYEVEGLFNENGFLRVHKSYVINTNCIKKISPSLDRKFVLTMVDGTQIDVTRSYFYKFKEHIGL